jgi:hypothetical protein
LVPAGAVEDEDGVRAGGDLGADLGQVRIHRCESACNKDPV